MFSKVLESLFAGFVLSLLLTIFVGVIVGLVGLTMYLSKLIPAPLAIFIGFTIFFGGFYFLDTYDEE